MHSVLSRLVYGVLVSLIVFVIFPGGIQAVTYYIDATDGSNSNNGLTPGAAWQTLSKASASPVASGDTVLLQRGETWSAQTLVTISGVTIDAYGSGNKPILDGASSTTIGINATTRSNVSVSNLDLRNYTSAHVFVSGSSSITLNDLDASGGNIPYRINNSTSVVMNDLTSSNPGNSAYFFQNATTATGNNLISTGTTAGSGFRIIDSATVTCNDCTASASLVDGFSLNNTSVLNCYRCKAYNNGSTGDSTSGDGYTAHDSTTMNIYSSIAYGNYKSGVAVTGSASGKVYNSTFYNNVQSTSGSGWDGSGDVGIGINATGTWDIKNNISFAHPVEFMITAVAVAGGATVTSNYNLFYDSLGGNAFDYNGTFYNFSGYRTASGKDSNSLNSNPMVTNASGNNFALLSSSPAIDAGTNTGLSTDYAGTSIPQNGAYDIGAYEFVPTSSSSSSGGGGSSMPTAPNCGDTKPDKTPRLFQINTTGSEATLYFTPAGDHNNSYYVAYGYTPNDERFGVEFHHDPTNSVVEYKIGALNPNTTYYFKVRGGNGCMPGNWSNALFATTLFKTAISQKAYTAWAQIHDEVISW